MVKIEKDKKQKKQKKQKKEDDDLMVSKGIEEIEEEYRLADLSGVKAPEIEFELPAAYAPKKTVTNGKNNDVLTAELLNKEIVCLRTPIQQAKGFLSQKLIRKRKFLTQKSKKSQDPKELQKIEKIGEELEKLKDMNKDEIAKFALINSSTREKLISGAKTPEEKVLYALVYEKPILTRIEEFRARYSDWKISTPFFLQRLGMQYSGKRMEIQKSIKVSQGASDTEEKDKKAPASKTKVKSKNSSEDTKKSGDPDNTPSEDNSEQEDDNRVEEIEKSPEEASEDDEEVDDADDAGDDDDDDDDDDDNDEQFSDVEMGTDSEDDSGIAEKRSLLLGLAGIKEDKNRPKLAPKKRKAVETDEENDSAEDDEPAELPPSEQKKNQKGQTKERVQEEKVIVKKEEVKKPTPTKQRETKTVKSLISEAVSTTMQDPEAQRMAKLKKSLAKGSGSNENRLPSLLNISKLQSSSEGIIQRIKLGDKGTVQFANARKPSETAPKKESTKNIDSFFKSCDGESDETGEESAGDDEDLPVLDYPKGEKGSTRQNVGRNKTFDRKGGSGFDRNFQNKSDNKRSFDKRGGGGSDRHFQNKSDNRSFDKRGGGGFDKKFQDRPDNNRSFDKRGGGGFDKNSRNKPDNNRSFEKGPGGRNAMPPKGPAGLPEDLHPSWAAKRLKQEQASAKPEGKRTVFSDD